ncbi:hypothetical protein I545_6687 [Mycobacterium kansasii 662]|uniref:Uncharacterized protein n=1 Tax=Mycobacterium kansasii 662 TaxID=1299326 RepID=X7Y124_MYCKA|nr:hypothetical protein I545_6687 [Mycobacterium kansasii 662]
MLLFMSGLALAGYGAVLVSENPPVIIMRIVVWALVAVALHDVVFAPLCAAMGLSSRRVLPTVWQAPGAVAALCTVVLVLLAIPVFDKPGASLDNATVLDRDYHAGLWISIAVVWACVPVIWWVGGFYQFVIIRWLRARAPTTLATSHQRRDRAAAGRPRRQPDGERQPDPFGLSLAQHAQVRAHDGYQRSQHQQVQAAAPPQRGLG